MKISIITVTFNCQNTISKTIESVIGQTYKNFEYIVIDGNSNDNTNNIINNYKERITYYISENDHGIYDAINKGIEISPLKLKLNTGINKADTIPFDGLFGVFADSLPDGWGKLLLDRALTAKGIDISNMTMLDRLAFVGSKGMGALIYKPEIDDGIHKQFEFEFEAQITN